MPTTEQIDRLIEEVRGYEKLNYGLKFGEDFPLVARALKESHHFEAYTTLLAMMNAVTGMKVKALANKYAPGDPKGDEEVLNMMKDANIGTLMEVFYIGYKLGKQEQEVTALENLTKS